jgi:hypothetical protein
MRARVREAAHVMQDVVGRVRGWFDPDLDADARPLEVREAILEQIERRVEPAGRGRRVLPWNRVSVTVLAPGKDRRAALEAALAGLEYAAVARLTELACEVPAGFALEIHYVKRPRSGWEPDRWIDIECGRSSAAHLVPAHPDCPRLSVTVVRGTASQASFTLAGPLILIGRTSDPVDQRGRTRHNHVAFVEDADECSRTVGRAHASIQYIRDRREYRLFDDGSRNGTRVVREGTVIEVAARDPVGISLRSGDEIRFGTAAVQIQLEPVEEAAGSEA